MIGGFVHQLNPVITEAGPITLYYYGLAYAVGFIGIHLRLRYRRAALGWTAGDVWNFSILFAVCVLLGGRLFSVAVYHWGYYRVHLDELFYYWQGGMATHGVLLGGVLAMAIYARRRKMSFLRLADEIVIPAAFLLALGRIGNFINGQIAGTLTEAWWGVQFPGLEGFRHPVTLYEAGKNLAIIPILWVVGRKYAAGKGQMAAHFVFWYGFLRLFTDLYRDHGALLFGIGRNQYFNALMAIVGVLLMIVFYQKRHRTEQAPVVSRAAGRERTGLRCGVFVTVLLFSLVIRSAWTPAALEQKRRENQTVHSQLLQPVHSSENAGDLFEQELEQSEKEK